MGTSTTRHKNTGAESNSGLGDYPALPRSRGKKRATYGLLGVAVVGFVAVLAIALAPSQVQEPGGDVASGGADGSGASEALAPTSTEPDAANSADAGPATEAEREAADARLAEAVASGWVPYAGDPASPEFVVPSPAWVDPGVNAVEEPERRRLVYDAPDGNLLGYHYLGTGFVPLGQESGFDAAQARVDRFGCDPMNDPDDSCKRSLEQELDEGP